MLRALDDLIERRIRDAQREGQFDDLPGAGKPLVIADDPLVPEEVRVAFRVLKNAGFVPTEVAALKDIDLLIAQIVDEAAAQDCDGRAAAGRLLALTMALERQGIDLTTHGALAYRRALMRKLQRGER